MSKLCRRARLKCPLNFLLCDESAKLESRVLGLLSHTIMTWATVIPRTRYDDIMDQQEPDELYILL